MALLRLLCQRYYENGFILLRAGAHLLARIRYLFLASAAFSCFISRDLRRAALLRWITPFFAARSSSLTAARTAISASTPEAIAWRAFVMFVFTIDLTIRLRRRRFCSWRMRLAAEGLLGMDKYSSPEHRSLHTGSFLQKRPTVRRP